MPLDDPDNPLAVEIRQEAAGAYFAACRKMVASLEALNAFDRTVTSTSLNGDQITQRCRLLEDAAQRVHFVLIQREAMKLSHFEHFFELYGVPAEVRDRMGVSGRKQQ